MSKPNDERKRESESRPMQPSTDSGQPPDPPLIPAAMYVRMSTEHQQYSTENQAEAIHKYAEAGNFDIIETYADEGKSGLNIEGREALQRLIQTVESGTARFKAILAYDISRWGRFQDTDEAAHYEYICRRAGITIHYCAEQFKNDGSMYASLVKGLKRGMAAEYSRELSNKVFIGQCRLIQLGYRQGGMAGYGLRRMLVDVAGNEKGILTHGEHKSLQTDRVVLVPGPDEEVETVRWMYRAFVHEGRREAEIADILNTKGVLSDGWLQCRDPDSPSGDRNPSAGVADGTGDAARGAFHSFRDHRTISVFDFLQQTGKAASFGEAVRLVADWSGVPLPNRDKPAEKKKAGSKPRPPSAYPSIVVNNRQMRSIVFDSWGVLLAANRKSPEIFLRLGKLVRVNFLTKPPRIDTIDPVYMHGLLIRKADWVRHLEDAVLDAVPPRDVARDMVAAPDASLPGLEIVTSIPIYAPDGELLLTSGYHPKAATWYAPAKDLKLPTLPDPPTAQDVANARSLILDDLLLDFPFEGDADRAHVVAALLLPFVRCMIDSPSPLHVIEAPEAGTGKGLLSDVISSVITGSSAAITTLPSQEDEIRKKITTILATGRDVILWDNVSGVVGSASLAAALTSRQWEDRKLGESVSLNLPNTCLWLLTGNNPRLSKEIARRAIRIRLDSGLENPADRPTSNFKHPELLSWVQKNRSELIAALLVLVRAWLAAGSPEWSGRSIGSFESWARVIGGILSTAGINGFLGNVDKLREQADIDSTELRAFVEEWHRQFESTEVKPADLNELCEREGLLLAKRGDKGERSQIIRLGKVLGGIKERIFGGLRVKRKQGRIGMLYYLESNSPSQAELPLNPFDLADLPDEEP